MSNLLVMYYVYLLIYYFILQIKLGDDKKILSAIVPSATWQRLDENTRRIASLVTSLVQPGMPDQHLQNPLSLAENSSADQGGSSSASIVSTASGKTCWLTVLIN